MMKKIIGIGLGSAMLLTLAVPAFAQDNTASTLGSQVKSCNQTAKDAIKSARTDFKNGSLTKTDLKAKLSGIETTRKSCVKDAQTQAQAAITAARAQRKAEMAQKAADAKAKRDARIAEMKAKAAARKASKTQ